MNQAEGPYLAKALESLAGADSELAAGRYNNAANRAYYAAFQAAIHALTAIGERRDIWGHDFVQAQFTARFIRRRKIYPSDLRNTLPTLLILRSRADYGSVNVTSVEANRAVRLARRFVQEVSLNR